MNIIEISGTGERMMPLSILRNRDANKKQLVCWFSAGITSTLATKIALEKAKERDDVEVDIIFFETGSHHPDNERFISECEKWFGHKIIRVMNPDYFDIFDVFEKRRYINGVAGAPCTGELKKKMRIEIEKIVSYDAQVFGFEYEKKEINRAIRFFEQYPKSNPVFPLIEMKYTKSDAVRIIESEGILIPRMYRLGYTNNNCIGCVKGGMGYWNRIRVDFPDVFQRFIQLERDIGASILKDKVDGRYEKMFLKDLDPDRGRNSPPITAECGVVCAVEFSHVISAKVEPLMNGESVIMTLDDRLSYAQKKGK